MNKPILKMYTAFKIINTHCYLFEEFKWVSQLFLTDSFAGLHIPIVSPMVRLQLPLSAV